MKQLNKLQQLAEGTDLNLYGNTGLSAALNRVLAKTGMSVDSLKRDQIYVQLPDNPDIGSLRKELDAPAFVNALKKFDLEYKDNDLESRVRRGDDTFIVYVKRA